MIDEQHQPLVRWRLQVILRAIAAEDEFSLIRVVDVTADQVYLESGTRHDGNIDTAIVVAIYQHDVIVELRADNVVLKANQRRTIFGFDQGDDVGTQRVDDLGRHACGDLVDCLDLQIEPADPVIASVSDDLQSAACRSLYQLAAVLTQNDELTTVGLLA